MSFLPKSECRDICNWRGLFTTGRFCVRCGESTGMWRRRRPERHRLAGKAGERGSGFGRARGLSLPCFPQSLTSCLKYSPPLALDTLFPYIFLPTTLFCSSQSSSSVSPLKGGVCNCSALSPFSSVISLYNEYGFFNYFHLFNKYLLRTYHVLYTGIH